QAASQQRQAVRRHGRDLARELPAEELPRGLSHPAVVLHAARPGVSRMSPRSVAAAVLALTAFASHAQGPYPAKPIRIIVPFGPGGFTDVAARILQKELAPAIGQPIIIENKP